MMALTTIRQPAFSLAQRKAITTWSSRRPQGLHARIVTHHPDYIEVAEILHRPTLSVLYSLNATDRGTVFLARASGGAWEVGGVEIALAKVLILEAVGWAQVLGDTGRAASKILPVHSDMSDSYA